MTSNNDLAQINVLGFDLGHGETALAYIPGCKDKTIPAKKVFDSNITAIAYLSTGDVVWGKTAISYQENAQAEVFDIGFKCKPGTDNKLDKKKISDFALTVYRDAKSSLNLNGQQHIELFMGCPSGWSDEEKEKYKTLFTQAGLPNVTVIAESEAAYAYYFEELKGKKNSKVSIGNIAGFPLILDFGSSTLDATVERKIGEPISDGINLGSSLIDEAILTWNLKSYRNSQYPLKTYITESYIEKINGFLESSRSAYAIALLKCREAKEKYFKKRETLPLTQRLRIVEQPLMEHPCISEFIPLYIFIDDEVIETLLNQPLKEILPSKSIPKDDKLGDLGTHSWLEWCQLFLQQKMCLELEKKGLSLKDIGIIAFTGGASLMPQVKKVVEQIFCDLDSRHIKYDSDPMLCIAKGLAIKGRMKIITTDFEKEVDTFCEDSDKGLWDVVFKHYKETKLVQILGDKFGEITKRKLYAWLKGNIDKSEQIGRTIRNEFTKWSKSEALTKEIQKELERIEALIRKDVNKLLTPIVEKYFTENVDFLPFSFLTENFSEIHRKLAKEYGQEIDDDCNFTLTSLYQNIAKRFAEAIEEDKTDFDSNFNYWNAPHGFGLRWLSLDESQIEQIQENIKIVGENMVIDCLNDKDFQDLFLSAIYRSLQVALKSKMNKEQYVLYALAE